MGTLTELAKTRLAPVLGEGALAVDATAGNGHDCLFLAGAVGESGHVWACDIQQAALDTTAQRLADASLRHRVTLVRDCHERLTHWLPRRAHERLSAVMFNLGYLPGGDHSLVTTAGGTVAALSQAASLLALGGKLSVLVYRGHPQAMEEYHRVLDWCRESPLALDVERFDGAGDPHGTSPVLLIASLRQ
ncbi:MAG: class I SAM-dependent methyltransferase [Oleiphilaceae bacterium]|nr:class I SAM-dependent methyltransferase [Oleiphilaceae bacterium]